MTRKSLYRGQVRSFHEVMKVKLWVALRWQDAGDARVTRHLPRWGADREWRQQTRKKCVSVSKDEMGESSNQSWSYRIWNLLCWVLVLLWTSIFPLLPHYSILEWLMYILNHCMLKICNLLIKLYEVLKLWGCSEFQKNLWTFKLWELCERLRGLLS